MQYEIMMIVFCLAACAYMLLVGVEKELLFTNELKLREIEFVDVTKIKFLFIFIKKENTITKIVFKITTWFYVVNLTLFALLVSSIILKIEWLFSLYFTLGIFTNLAILGISVISIPSSAEEEKIKDEYRKKRLMDKKRRKENNF